MVKENFCISKFQIPHKLSSQERLSLLKRHFFITERVGLIKKGLLYCGETCKFLDPNICGLTRTVSINDKSFLIF
jgi:hypothetical protein